MIIYSSNNFSFIKALMLMVIEMMTFIKIICNICFLPGSSFKRILSFNGFFEDKLITVKKSKNK